MSKITCWTLTSGKIGCQKQANGVAKALGLNYQEKIFERASPWHLLPPRWDRHPLRHAKAHSSALETPYPDLIIACGMRCIPFMFAAKKASGGKTALIYVQNPHLHPKYFDAIIAPRHDHMVGENVISTLGATNDIDIDLINNEAEQLREHFSEYPMPYTSIFLGGSTKNYQLNNKRCSLLGQQLLDMANQHSGSLLISPSRRTGSENIAYLKKLFAKHPRIFFHDGKGVNPYYAMLGLADKIIATNDSVSIVSETCSTGKPVFLLELPAYKPYKKAREFIDDAINGNYLHRYQTDLEYSTFNTLNETQRIIPQLKQLLAPKVTL